MSHSDERKFRAGAGRLCLDFIRTLRYRGQPRAEEELAGATDLARWVGQFGPCRATQAVTDPDCVVHAQELREAINVLITSALGAGEAVSCSPAERARINSVAARPVPAPRITDDGGLAYHAEDPINATLAMVARDAIELVTSTDLGRLRCCANPDCRILFVDRSRPGTRRWCSMQTCGNRAKKVAQRQRTRRQRPGAAKVGDVDAPAAQAP